MELSNALFLSNSSGKATSKVTFEWMEDGAFLLMKTGENDALWLISRDETDYKIFYYDKRQVSRVYEMNFKNNIWKIWRNVENFSQRFKGKIRK